MSELLFHAFVNSLERDRICVDPRDYQRIRLLLSSRRDWTLSSIRDSLGALLVHDRDQRRTFDRRFDDFFARSRADDEQRAVDLVRALRELAGARPAKSIVNRQTPAKKEPALKRDPTEPKSSPNWWLAALSLTLLAGTLISVVLMNADPNRPVQTQSGGGTAEDPSAVGMHDLRFESELHFRAINLGSKAEGELKLTNTSATKEYTINALAIAGDHHDFASSDLEQFNNLALGPGQSRSLTVSFTPQALFPRYGAVVADVADAWPMIQASLTGVGSFDPMFGDPDSPLVPKSLNVKIEPQTYSAEWQSWLVAGVTFSMLFVGLCLYVYFWRKPPRDASPAWRANKDSERFSFADVGGRLPPMIAPREAKRLGDMLDFVETEAISPHLNIDKSIRATICAGGIPALYFHPQTITREVLILEDGLVHTDFRSPLVDDLCDGLSDTGVAVRRLRFRGSAERLTNEHGAVVRLAELERQRDTFAALLFTDGSSFAGADGLRALEQLAEWPRVAWLDFREPQFRAASGDMPHRQGIRVFAATSTGLRAALYSFLVAGWGGGEEPATAGLPRLLAQADAPDEAVYLEAVLGDALLWAGDCSFLQPCSPALAEQLRGRFHRELPRTCWQRLLRMPGARLEAAGLCFDRQAMRLLRRAWLIRRSGSKQREVLQFILDQLQRGAPPTNDDGPENMARLTWEASVERLRLELDPSNLQRLARLGSSPAGRYVAASLEGFSVRPDDPKAIPLRAAPANQRDQQRLASLAPNIGITRLQAIPLKRRHWAGLTAALLGCIGCLVMTLIAWQQPPLEPYWQVVGPDAERVVLEEQSAPGDSWQVVGHWSGKRDSADPLPVTGRAQGETSPNLKIPDRDLAGVASPIEISDSGTVKKLAVHVEITHTFISDLKVILVAPDGTEAILHNNEEWSKRNISQTYRTSDVAALAALIGKPIKGTWKLNVADAEAQDIGRLVRWAIDLEYERSDAIAELEDSQWREDSPLPRKKTTYRVGIREAEDSTKLAIMETFELSGSQRATVVLKSTKETEKSEPMRLAWITPGTFQMGSPTGEKGRSDQETPHDVTLTLPYYLGVTEVTQAQYQEIMEENPSTFKAAGPDAPVVNVSWHDAVKFCRHLTNRERELNRLPQDWEYRLPTEAQWEYACRAGARTAYSFGDDPQTLGDYAWYADNAGGTVHAVGQKSPNGRGLHDMHGNVWEWCQDRYATYPSEPATDPQGPFEGSDWVIRGGSRGSVATSCRSAFRGRNRPSARLDDLGFRVAAVQAEPAGSEPEGRGRALELVWIPPGTFQMGSPEGEPNRREDETQHTVQLTKGFYLSKYEITQARYTELIGNNPSTFKENGADAPVENVSWYDAVEFCSRLTVKHRKSGQLPSGYVYRLPTEAQWEYACRAGEPTAYSFGDDPKTLGDYAWYEHNADSTTHAVGQKKANAWGLHDMHGNVWELCQDRFDEGAANVPSLVMRGGSLSFGVSNCRSAFRFKLGSPDHQISDVGFRVAAVQEAEQEASPRDEGE